MTFPLRLIPLAALLGAAAVATLERRAQVVEGGGPLQR